MTGYLNNNKDKSADRIESSETDLYTYGKLSFNKSTKEIKQKRKISSTNSARKTGCSVEKQKQNLDTYS